MCTLWNSEAWLTLVRLLRAAASPRGQVSAEGRVGRGLLMLALLREPVDIHFVGPRGPGCAQQGVLVFAETQDDVDAVDAASSCGAPAFPQVVEGAGGEAAVVHHAHGIQW